MKHLGLSLVTIMFFACGHPLEELEKEVENYGYILYRTPMTEAKTGTLVGGTPQHLAFMAQAETCFPTEFAGAATNLRVRDRTTLPERKYSFVLDLEVHGSFLESLKVGAPSIGAAIGFHEVQNVEIDFEDVHVEYLDGVALLRFYQQSMDPICRSYLEDVAFITQALVVGKMRFLLFNVEGGKIEIDANNIEAFFDISADVSWEVSDDFALVIDSPKYLAYQLGVLRSYEDGFTFYRASKVEFGKFVFEKISVVDQLPERRLQRGPTLQPALDFADPRGYEIRLE